jgi:hypothetical protein
MLAYDAVNETETRRNITYEMTQTRKINEDININATNRLILTSPNGTRYSASIDNSGVLSWTAL